MTWFKWWHKHARIWFRPKPVHVAEKWTQNLSKWYVFFGWNAVGLIIYNLQLNYKKKDSNDETDRFLSPAQIMARDRGVEHKAKIIRIDGFNVKTLNAGTKNSENINK